MAIDKAVDSAQLDAGLTSIADNIRAKGGTSAALTFPDGFAAAIAAIAAGDSSSIGVESGTYTPSANTQTFDAEVSQAAHDRCLLITCTANADDLSGFVVGDYAAWSIHAFIYDATSLGEMNNVNRYVTTRVLWQSGAATNSGINQFMLGSYVGENKIAFGVGAALSAFKAGIKYTWNVYYTREASS